MKTYNLNIAGLRIYMQLPKHVSITERIKPFLYETTENIYDCNLEVKVCDTISQIVSGGCRHGLEYYAQEGGNSYIYHFKDAGPEPFAVTCFDSKGNVQLCYLKKCSEYFQTSSGIFNRVGLENVLLLYRRMILHASFVKHKDGAILFTAPSGTGKSTQAELWRKIMHAEVVNGDRAAVGMTSEGCTAWGIPYAGSSGIYRNEKASVKAIVVLRQAQHNQIRRLNPIDAFSYLYSETLVHYWEKWFVEETTDLLKEVVLSVPVYMLECLPNEGAVELLDETLSNLL